MRNGCFLLLVVIPKFTHDGVCKEAQARKLALEWYEIHLKGAK